MTAAESFLARTSVVAVSEDDVARARRMIARQLADPAARAEVEAMLGMAA